MGSSGRVSWHGNWPAPAPRGSTALRSLSAPWRRHAHFPPNIGRIRPFIFVIVIADNVVNGFSASASEVNDTHNGNIDTDTETFTDDSELSNNILSALCWIGPTFSTYIIQFSESWLKHCRLAINHVFISVDRPLCLRGAICDVLLLLICAFNVSLIIMNNNIFRLVHRGGSSTIGLNMRAKGAPLLYPLFPLCICISLNIFS